MSAYTKLIFICIFLLFPTFCSAQPYYGFNFSYALHAKEPEDLRGFQFMLTYDPQYFKWRKFNIYFDAGFSHFWINNKPYHRILNIYSIAPVIRYTFRKAWCVHPYLELSIGLAYLNHTHFEHRNLGIHFAFQDRMGIGVFIGKTENFTIGIHAVHYSNAHLSEHNSGVSVPLMLDIGYRFC